MKAFAPGQWWNWVQKAQKSLLVHWTCEASLEIVVVTPQGSPGELWAGHLSFLFISLLVKYRYWIRQTTYAWVAFYCAGDPS